MAENETALPRREEIPSEDKWRLEDIYADDQHWEQDFQKLKELITKVNRFKGTLQQPGQLLGALRLQDEIGQLNERVFVYARMGRDEDNANPVYQTLTDRANSLSVEASAALAFLVPEILAIPEAMLKDLFDQDSELSLYRHFIDEITRVRPHVLSVTEEQLLAQAGELADAPQNIFTMLNNADLKFPYIQGEQGNNVELTKGRYTTFLESKDRRVRHDAFHALYATYGAQQNTLAATLNASVKKDVFYARVHKYRSALEAALDNDNLPLTVYDNLIEAVHANLGPLHRYVAVRKKALELADIHMYDLYTPLVREIEMKIPYREALRQVEEGLAPLGQEYLAILKQGFASGWIDVRENQGKTSGAYSWGAYVTHPYVLLNWQDNVNNLFTVAHEMGHSLHTYYSNKSQPYVYAGYKIFVAEVASTVNESLLMQHMLRQTTDKQTRLYLLNYYLEQFRGTIYRQTMFAEFEKDVHARIEAGEALTVDSLNKVYHDLNVTYYGPDIVVDPEIDLEWARIPHFYTNFYVYKYATGFSAATALSQQILNEGEPAVKRYLEFLKGGSSDYPANLLRKAGVDMTTPEPVTAALKVFADTVAELESLL
ncbi:MAG TPA: oligoendopeptidase F [Desulfobacteria bacterium]|nr:oligoendopeptidase F [Desulfobacteria bacterium]